MDPSAAQNPYTPNTTAPFDDSACDGPCPSIISATASYVTAFAIGYAALAVLENGRSIMMSLLEHQGLDRIQAAFQLFVGAGLSILSASPLLLLIRSRRPTRTCCLPIGLVSGAAFVHIVSIVSPPTADYLLRSKPLGAAVPFFPITIGLWYAGVPVVFVAGILVLATRVGESKTECTYPSAAPEDRRTVFTNGCSTPGPR